VSPAARRDLGRFVAAAALVFGSLELVSLAETPTPPRAARSTDVGRELSLGQGAASYTLRASLDTSAHRVRGEGTLRWTNTSRVPQRELWLHAYLNAFKDDETRFMRSQEGVAFRGRGRLDHHGALEVHRLYARELNAELWGSVQYGEPGDETDARVLLPTAVAPGESLTLEVAFTATLPSLLMRTGYVERFNMVAQWFPKLARLEPDGHWAHFAFDRLSEFYADFGDYDVSIDVPKSYLVGASGVQVGSEDTADRRRHRFLAPRVHDFAFAAWDGFEEIRQMAGDVELVSLFPKGETVEAELELGVLTRGLVHFGERYGSYPYRRLTVVRPPFEASEAGGMEYPTLITTGASTRFRALGMRTIESLTLHELAHQWFYGMLASDEHQHPFLDEGLTSYAEVEAMDTFWPGRSGFDAFGLRVSEAAAYRIAAGDAEGHGAVDRPSNAFGTGREYVGLAYARPATALVTLGRVFGEESLRRALRRYAREQRFSHPVPSDLVAAVRAEVGDVAADALAAVLAGGTLDVQLEAWASHREADGRTVGTVSLRRLGAVALPVEVDVTSADGTVTRLRWDGASERVTLPWRGDAPIVSVLVDPDNRLLLDGSFDGRAAGGTTLAPRVWSLATVAAQLGASVVWP